MFILMSTWIIEKSLMKLNYLRKNNFIVTWIWKMLQKQITCMRKDLKYEKNNYIYNFQQSEIIKSFGDNIYTNKIGIDEAEMD